MNQEDVKKLKDLIDSPVNPISIITQNFSDIDIKNEFQSYNIDILESEMNWKEFTEFFYSNVGLKPIISDRTKNRLFVINTDMITKMPDKRAKIGIDSIIRYIATKCPIKVIFITEKPIKKYKMIVHPTVIGNIIDYSNFEYVANVVLHEKDFSIRLDTVKRHYNDIGSMFPLMYIIQNYIHRYHPIDLQHDFAVNAFFRMQFKIDSNVLATYIASSFFFDENMRVKLPDNFFTVLKDKNVWKPETDVSYIKNL